MKKPRPIDITLGIVATVLLVGSITYFIITPAKSDPVCTTEFVQQYGSADCEQQSKADQNESDAFQGTRER